MKTDGKVHTLWELCLFIYSVKFEFDISNTVHTTIKTSMCHFDFFSGQCFQYLLNCNYSFSDKNIICNILSFNDQYNSTIVFH